ncbi:type 1 fimbrial protein [Buttiauxella sp. B2]|uniref:fimbrial protein n=1 Tax=Buttiauxella sp. B2 TaxID=2587812 RepID=UPI00111FED12|nr:fimbrial protein [Buttiauxella sp. B2]TNV11216.1 type 1 fimbrial protein [Buttiauxella sp. B2]
MKKNLIAAAVAAVTVLSAASAFAADGTVNFTGEIIDTACTIDIGANNTMTVDLGHVARTSFTGVGSTATATKFVLKAKDCPATVSSATVKFDGVGYVGDDSVLSLTPEAGVATGVAVQLSDASMAQVPLFTASTAYPLQTSIENDLTFYARYIQMASVVTAGPANSVATFTLNYQ